MLKKFINVEQILSKKGLKFIFILTFFIYTFTNIFYTKC